jgi:ATP-binding cassette subfamily C protein CydC
VAQIDAVSAAVQTFLAVAAAVAVIILSAGAPLATLALAAFGALAAMDGASVLARRFERSGEYRAALLRLQDWFASEPLVGPPAESTAEAHGHPQLTGEIALRQGEAWASLPPGGRVQIEGRSGAGKTILVETLLGLRPDMLERLRIDGAAISDWPLEAVRALFAWSPQDTSLVSGTVRDNLLLGRPGADESELWRALHDAVLEARVRRSSEGLDAWVGEGGARLAGGERRRLCLARALLRPAPCLVLDEPAEGLDPPTARQLVERLEARLERTGQGLILVSHREEPVRLCEHGVLWRARDTEESAS